MPATKTVPSGDKVETRAATDSTSLLPPSNATTARLPLLMSNGELDANQVQRLKLEAPKAMLQNGLKHLQEFVHGHRAKLDDADLMNLKVTHRKLREIGKGDSVNAVQSADFADITKNVRILDDQKRTGTRQVVIKCETDIGWSPE